MGLDQSIFTNSKEVAQAIYEGNIPSGKWCDACFSPRTISDNDDLTRFDIYANNRLIQAGVIHNRMSESQGKINALGLGDEHQVMAFPWNIFGQNDRTSTLRLMETMGSPNHPYGVAISEDNPLFGGTRVYQIGLFRKVNALHGWMNRKAKAQIPSDEAFAFNAPLFLLLRNDCQRVLDAFTKGQKKGEKIAKRVLPTCKGFYFGSYDYDDEYVNGIKELLDFTDIVLSVCDDDTALFTYNPWY